MWHAMEHLKFPFGALGAGQAREYAGRRARGAQSRQPPGHGPGIPQAAENTVDAGDADRWKKLRQIERGDHGLASMHLCAAEAGAAMANIVARVRAGAASAARLVSFKGLPFISSPA